MRTRNKSPEKRLQNDTIAAIATAPGEAGIGIVRISGPQALVVLSSIFTPKKGRGAPLKSHMVCFGSIIDPRSGKPLDQCLAIYMKNPKSYTGEDCAEISCHGGRALLNSVLEAAIFAGARPAERGEFTKRAFLNGKLDLSQAEAVIDLIKASTKEGVFAAADQLSGGLSRAISEAREGLLSLLARIEAGIDFPDDVAPLPPGAISEELKAIQSKICDILSTADAGRILKEGLGIAIIGRPNVGKSSLLNAILKEERAIVTEIPGTTRDTIEETASIKGFPFRVIDTAGLREPKDPAEKMGVERAETARGSADICLLVLDASEHLTKEDMAIISKEASEGSDRKAIVVLNKIDKAKKGDIKNCLRTIKGLFPAVPTCKVSALSGEGIPELEKTIMETSSCDRILDPGMPVITNIRHKEGLFRAKEALDRALEAEGAGREEALIAIDLKEAVSVLGQITGEEASEEVIGMIFSEFCVGK